MNDVDELWHGRAQALTMLLTIHSYARKGRPKGSLNLEAAGGRNGHAESRQHTISRNPTNAARPRPPPSTAPAALQSSKTKATAMPRAYQRAVRRTPDSDDELTGPGETQGTIRCATQPMPIPSIRQGGEDIEDEDDPLADFNEMDRQVDEEESVQQELCAEGLL
ncbi:hypothetical protein HRG_014580 [Hirsutella rhossiliensis]